MTDTKLIIPVDTGTVREEQSTSILLRDAVLNELEVTVQDKDEKERHH